MNEIQARLAALRAKLSERGMAACLMPTSGPHGPEYLTPHHRARQYFSGFTGSAGTLLVTAAEAFLWTDGRYFLQAEQELASTGITLMRMGEPDVPSLEDYFLEHLAGQTVGVDGACLPARDALRYSQIVRLRCEDLAQGLWQGRPPLSAAPAYALPLEYAGVSAAKKLHALRSLLLQQGCRAHIISALCDIAWLLNLRGSDIPHTPVPLCFCAVEQSAVYLFMDAAKAAPALTHLRQAGVTLLPYAAIYTFAKRYGAGDALLIDAGTLDYNLFCALREGGAALRDAEQPPIPYKKMIKNAAELAALRQAHLYDGIALVRFMRWVQTNAGQVTELSAARKLNALRLACPGCVDISFDTICAYGPHGAIVHYSATAQSDSPLLPQGLLLVDSGGQYQGATTDVTRTLALGVVTPEQKKHYTLVLRGMLALQCARFAPGADGAQLDRLAREPLQQQGLDYKHGTGHGVGAMLSVHEPPVSIAAGRASVPFLPGMVVSDEPGVYIENSHGIRIENQLECVAEGGMLAFAPLTLAPIDTAPIDPAYFTSEDAARLNAYHAKVYAALSPHLNAEECAWLQGATRPI
ncbi:MAG: aminopeptidase P family protein [Christensenellaceae bacterium]|nr:aminopeptidase P family protein [Christensenellaceae bacterium]